MDLSFTKAPVIGPWRSQERGFVRSLTPKCPLRTRYDPELCLFKSGALLGAPGLNQPFEAQFRAQIGAQIRDRSGLNGASFEDRHAGCRSSGLLRVLLFSSPAAFWATVCKVVAQIVSAYRAVPPLTADEPTQDQQSTCKEPEE